MKKNVLGMIIVSFLMFFTIIFGRPSYIGYSGAPGSNGYCASSCHGSSGGTIQIDGFPDEYVSEQTYAITISHSDGNSIRRYRRPRGHATHLRMLCHAGGGADRLRDAGTDQRGQRGWRGCLSGQTAHRPRDGTGHHHRHNPFSREDVIAPSEHRASTPWRKSST